LIVLRIVQGYDAGDFFAKRNVVELAEAAQTGRLTRVSELVGRGVNPNARGYQGITPLIYAMSGITLNGFRRLLELGADPNLQMENGDSVMTLTAACRDPEALKLAIAFRGNPNLRIPFKLAFHDFWPTPLFVTVVQNRLENARILIKAGADMNARSFDGKTALMEAASQGRYEMMYVLLEAGADPRARNNKGDMASYDLLDRVPPAPSSDTAKWRQRCMEFMARNGIDFEKERARYAEIHRGVNAGRNSRNVTASQKAQK